MSCGSKCGSEEPSDALKVCTQTFEGTFDNASSGIKEFGTAVGASQEGGFSQHFALRCVYILISNSIYYILSERSGVKGFEPSTSWSRNSVPKILKALSGVAYVNDRASFSLSVVPKLYPSCTQLPFPHDCRYIFAAADPSGRGRMVAPGNPGLNRHSWRRFANSTCPIRTFELTDFHVFCLH